VADVLVDDALAVRLDGTDVFAYSFSTSGRPVPAVVEIPRATMEQLAGRAVTIEYRDLYAVVVEASAMWLIWSPQQEVRGASLWVTTGFPSPPNLW